MNGYTYSAAFESRVVRWRGATDLDCQACAQEDEE